MALSQTPIDVPSPIDFNDPVEARAWVDNTVARRPWRPRFFEAFASTLNVHFGKAFRAVELGSGPGHLAGTILRNCEVESYVAVDFSNAMHDLAREFLGLDAGRVSFVLEDFRQSHWVTSIGVADAVLTMQAAHEVRHKTRLPNLFKTIYMTIRPDRLFLYCDHYSEDGSTKNSELHVTREQQPDLLDEGGMALYSAFRP
jgi:hypothetical protein